jgi:hypothetical protein
VGYQELFSYFDEDSLQFAIDEIKKNTRRFAKRQLTWFRRDENTKWFDYLTHKDKIIDYMGLNSQYLIYANSSNFSSVFASWEINFTQPNGY